MTETPWAEDLGVAQVLTRRNTKAAADLTRAATRLDQYADSGDVMDLIRAERFLAYALSHMTYETRKGMERVKALDAITHTAWALTAVTQARRAR